MNESEPMEELDCSAGDSGKLTHQKALPSEEDGKVNAGEVDKVAGNMAPQKPAPSEENCAVAEKVDQEAFLAPRKEDCGGLATQKSAQSEEDNTCAGEVDKVAVNMAPQKAAPSEDDCEGAAKVDKVADNEAAPTGNGGSDYNVWSQQWTHEFDDPVSFCDEAH